ncbi:extracellular solute-binding protein [Pseudomonas sp. S31]|uniref:ABC transporter substrate-binding protein n=1 Tax=Pseudomonas sp. S31 TaxID=1564473 RepID=UPI001914912C|nr:extracellular solute-binding protein [Pseudomonas sp. S31]MBK4999734.1 extracellular solute-binding protein [Pseudomonas sp. S31]
MALRSTPVHRRWLPAVALLSLLAGCGPAPSSDAQAVAPAPPAALNPLYQAAQQAGEKELVVYTAFPETVALWQAFEADYPAIKIKPTQATQLYTRLAGEQAAGRPIGDVVLTGYSELSELVRQDRLQADIPASSATVPARYKQSQGYFQIPWVNAFTLAYNTTQFTAQNVPQTWPQILEPRFSGRFAHVRFVGASPFDAAIVLLQEEGKLSDEQLQLLHDNAQVADNPGTLTANLAQGRTDFVLWAPAQVVARLRDQGAPVALAFPENVAILYGPGVALLKQAPHPQAARLFKEWLFTPRAQAIIASREYAYGTLPGSAPPPGFPSIDQFQQKDIPFELVNAYFDRYREKTRKLWP